MALGESDVLWGDLGLPKRVFQELQVDICEAPYDPVLEVPEYTTSAPSSIGKQVTKDQRRMKSQEVFKKIGLLTEFVVWFYHY